MERAGFDLLTRPERITDIGLNVGYETSSSFCKAFKSYAGVSPRRFRDTASRQWFAKTNRSFHPVAGYRLPEVARQIPVLTVLPPIKVAYVENRGLSEGSFVATARKSYSQLLDCITAIQLEDAVQSYVGIYPSRFVSLEDQDVLSYTGAIIAGEMDDMGNIHQCELGPGRHAIFNHYGPYEFMMQTWNAVYLNWLPKSRLVLRDGLPFELYLNPALDAGVQELTARIFIPVR
jgi:AraC family transcriptional regulator